LVWLQPDNIFANICTGKKIKNNKENRASTKKIKKIGYQQQHLTGNHLSNRENPFPFAFGAEKKKQKNTKIYTFFLSFLTKRNFIEH